MKTTRQVMLLLSALLLVSLAGITSLFVKRQPEIPESSTVVTGATAEPTTEVTFGEWKTYVSVDGTFEYKYPGDLYLSKKLDDNAFFYKDQIVAERCMMTKAEECLSQKMLSIGVSSYAKSGFTDKFSFEPTDYRDAMGRKWKVSLVLAGNYYNYHAVGEINGRMYVVSVQSGVMTNSDDSLVFGREHGYLASQILDSFLLTR